MAGRIIRRSELTTHVGRSAAAVHHADACELVYDHAWQRVAQQRRHADCHLCQACLAEERLTPSNEVDHVIPIHVRMDWRLEFDNTQVICRMHHSKKTIADARRYGSSTTRVLTPAQEQARLIAQQVVRPPRAPPGGRSKPGDVKRESVSPPARIPPRNWALGVVCERP